MDEEENQEEPVSRKVLQGKDHQKLANLTDEEDSADKPGSDSEGSWGSRNDGEAEEDRHKDAEDSDGEDGAAKGVEGAAAGVLAQLQDLSSDDDAEKCPICLHSFLEQPVATPMGCQHHFCLDCILEWSKNVNSCPVDRITFSGIHLRKCYGGKVQKTIPVQEPVKVEEEEINVDFDQTSCEVCGRSDREDRLLLCDGCDAGYHIECLTPPLDAVPVEEWFCPECTSNNPHTDSAEEVSEDEVAALLNDAVPTSSRLRSSTAGRTRSIARTRQSERVRATVNRNRISQAHAIQHVPRYLIQSTWLDETISAVLNSSACARRGRTGEKHRKTQRKKAGSESSSSSSSKNRTAGKHRKLLRGPLRSTKPGHKQVGKKDLAPHSHIKSSTTGKLKQSPSARPLGNNSKSRPTSLSIYGEPLDLDPFADESSAEESVPLMDMSRRGLSHSALRSHQPVARPVQHGLSRRSSMSEEDVIEDSAPVSDLLGSILSGQKLLLRDSSTMVINRDGSLKLGKPACASSSKTSTSSHSNTFQFETEVHAGMPSGPGLNRDPEPSLSFSHIAYPLHNFPGPSSLPAKPTLPHPIMPRNTNSCSPNLVPKRSPDVSMPNPVNPVDINQRGWSRTSASSPSLPPRATISLSDLASRQKGVDTGMGTRTVKTPPSKPVWLDLSKLPRIPKIRRGADRRTSLQGLPWTEQGSAEDNSTQKQDRAGTSCTTSSSSSWSFALHPRSSSPADFCISSSCKTTCPTGQEGHITSLGSVENRLSDRQSWNVEDPSHAVGSGLLGSDDVPEGHSLDHHAQGVALGEKGVVPFFCACDYEHDDFQIKPEAIHAMKDRNRYSGYSENIKMERLEGEPSICNSRTDVTKTYGEKSWSHNVLSYQKQDSSLHTEKKKSKPKDEPSRSRPTSCFTMRGKSNPQGRDKLVYSSQSGTETKRKSGEETACCSHSEERKSTCSSSEGCLCESLQSPRRRCSLSRSPHRWSHSSSRDPSRTEMPSKREHEWHNRKGSESHGFSETRVRSRTRSRSRSIDRRKDQARMKSSHRLEDRSRSKDGKRLRSRSQSRDRKNEKNASHSSRPTEISLRTDRPTCVPPTDMENNHKTFSLKYPKDLTDQEEMQHSNCLSPSDVSKLQKLRVEKNVSLSPVKEQISAFVFHGEKGFRREENKKMEKKGKRAIKPDLEKIADTELNWEQSHVKSSCESRMPSSVETVPKSAILPIGKNKFCKVTESAESFSPQNEEKILKESLPATDPKERSREICAEFTEHNSLMYNLNSLGVRRPDKTEITGTTCETGRTLIKDTPETVGGMEAAIIKDTPETVGGMEAAIITDTLEIVGDMESTVMTDTPVTVGEMEAAMITDIPETVGDMEAALTTNTPEIVADMESTVIADTPETVGDMEATMATDKLVTVDDMEINAVADTPKNVWDMGAVMITAAPDIAGDTVSTIITETSEIVGDMDSPVVADTPDTAGDMEAAMITDTPEIVGDMESTVMTDTPVTVGEMSDATIMDRSVDKQEVLQALKPAVITAFGTNSGRPMKRVTWSLQELDAPLAHSQPTRLLSPNTLRQSDKDDLQIPASPFQDMKKLHLRERAIEEVKLAISPFFQKKEITKDEYKEIWGKAVQKICCSKSGEISPERVANLVKAYVEKYKFLKKQQKDRRSQELEGTV